MEQECGVCCSSTGNERLVKCVGCGYDACHACVEKFLLVVAKSDPHCMNCREPWDILFLRLNLRKNFIDGPFKEHRKAILLRRSATHFVCPCPSCHYGRISRNSMTCMSCGVSVCDKCHIPKASNHICDEQVIRSLDAIGQMTKSCPGCRAPIEKASGCFQMFCTNCYTAFDWKNGKPIEKINLHNPHYFHHKKQKSLLDSFHRSINNLTDYSFKWVCKEFCGLIGDIEDQITANGGVECGGIEADEERMRNLCQHALWVSYHKRGLEIVRSFLETSDGNNSFQQKVRCFKDDLRNVLIDFNEHVADCLQLRGCRLFPCNPPVLCM